MRGSRWASRRGRQSRPDFPATSQRCSNELRSRRDITCEQIGKERYLKKLGIDKTTDSCFLKSFSNCFLTQIIYVSDSQLGINLIYLTELCTMNLRRLELFRPRSRRGRRPRPRPSADSDRRQAKNVEN